MGAEDKENKRSQIDTFFGAWVCMVMPFSEVWKNLIGVFRGTKLRILLVTLNFRFCDRHTSGIPRRQLNIWI